MELSTYSVDPLELFRVYIDDIEVVGIIKISEKLKNKLDIQSGSGANKGSITYQGRELTEFSMSIQVPFHWEDELDQLTFAQQDERVLQARSKMFSKSKNAPVVKIKHPQLTSLGISEVICKDSSVDQGDEQKTYSFEMIEYVAKSKVKPQAPASPDNFGDAALKDELANAVSGIGDP